MMVWYHIFQKRLIKEKNILNIIYKRENQFSKKWNDQFIIDRESCIKIIKEKKWKHTSKLLNESKINDKFPKGRLKL